MSELKLDILSDIDKLTSMSELEDVWDACADRMGELKQARMRKLKKILHVGDTIRLSPRMKPRYLGEVEAPIVELNGNRATLQLPKDSSLRKMSGTVCIVPLSAISARVRKAP